MTGVSFGDFGATVWNLARKDDAIGPDMMAYFADKGKDKAVQVMCATLGSAHYSAYRNDDMLYGAYHALCGLGLLCPYIDKEGVECARLTPAGREVYALRRAENDNPA